MSGQPNSYKRKADPSYCKFGSETILKLLEGFEAQIQGIIESKDIEYVHRMRVGSRRLRAAMPLFQKCYPKKKFKKWLKEIKKVTRLLGEARDLDVQIAFIQEYIQQLKSPTERAALKPLFRDRKTQRNAIQANVTNGLEELKNFTTLKQMAELCQQTIMESTASSFNSDEVRKKAYWNVSSKIDDFVALEPYVHQETKILKHHEMRIKAKWLRYTMEVFSPLYENKLAEAIQTTKNFQDVLGEMHDCDVWIGYIPKFTNSLKIKTNEKTKENPTKVENALLNFLSYIKEKRKERYNEFVSLWDENKKNGFFDQLRKTIMVELTITEEKTKKLLEDPRVKIAVLADVHANLQALEKVFQDAEKRGAQVFLNAGDSIGFGPCPNEVIELLCEKNVLSILGNYDTEVIKGETKDRGGKKLAMKFTRKELAKSCEEYLDSFPHEIRLNVADKKLLVTHGSPESIDEHIYHDTPVERLKTLADIAKADAIIVGHSHEQFWKQANGASFVNPGSVGRPGDGNPKTAYAILTFNPFKVELIRLDYNIKATAGLLRKKGLPECFSQMLLRGVSLDTIIDEDKIEEDFMVQNCEDVVTNSWKFAKKCLQDTEHSSHVAQLALGFFDGLIKLHKLGARERCWLENAAILHDVGLSKGRTGHHKKSVELILNDTQMPFTSEERRIIASIARYHRKGLPKQKHYNLGAMNRETIHNVTVLASILRVADSLDYTHLSIVKSVNIKLGTKKITAECTTEDNSTSEEQAFNKKKGLFETTFGKKLVLAWKTQ